MFLNVSNTWIIFLIGIVSVFAAISCYGADLDNLLSGFEEETIERSKDPQSKDSQVARWLTVEGGFSLQSTVNFNHDAPSAGDPDCRGISMFCTRGELIADGVFSGWKSRVAVTASYDWAYRINGQRDRYSDQYLDDYESEVELNEAYVQGSLSSQLDVKLGRQVVVWGKADHMRVTDILNPLDLRHPGLVDIRYLRLPVTMSRFDYYQGAWSLGAVVIHEPRFDKLPVYNGEFYPFQQPEIPVETLEWNWNNQQFGLSLNGIFSGWDIAFYAASVFDGNHHVERSVNGDLHRVHERVFMTGVAANFARGNWLLKGEAAYWDGLRYSTVPGEKTRFDILAGLEYMGLADTSVSFEIAHRHIINFDSLMATLPDGNKEHLTHLALSFGRDFINDTLHFTFLASLYDLFGSEAGFERLQIDYDISDFITLTWAVVFYQSGDLVSFTDIGDNDRFLFELEYRF